MLHKAFSHARSRWIMAVAALLLLVGALTPGTKSLAPGEILTSATNFTLSGNVTNLTPGVQSTLTLTAANPFSTDSITVTSVAVSVTSVTTSCPVIDLSFNGAPFTALNSPLTNSSLSVSVGANSSASFAAGTLLLTGGNTCENTTFNFSYSGTATYTDATKTTLVSSLNPSNAGQQVTYTATVAPSMTGETPAPAGTVKFYDGTSQITCATGSQAFNGTTASCLFTYTSTAGSPHSITATFLPSGNNYATSTSSALSQVVQSALLTPRVILVAAPNLTTLGWAVGYAAVIVGSGPSPTGTVTFYDGGNPIVSCGTNGVVPLPFGVGVAGCIVTYTSTLGSPHVITAVYSGNSNYRPGTSNTVSEVVHKRTPTDTLTSSVNPTSFGTAVTYTATLSGPGVAPTGSVTFKDGSTAITSCGSSGVVALSSGVAKCIVSYTSTPGSPHSITAAYSGDANYNSAASNTVSEVVNKATATDTLTSSANPTGFGTAVTYTATLVGSGAAPTGSVTFKDGSTAITSCGTSGVVTLSSGVAKCIVTYTSTSGSPHSITAAYSGDPNYNSAASNTVSEVVNKATATDTLSSSVNPTSFGTAVTYTATLTGPGVAPTGSVTFKDGSTAITSCGSSGVVTLSSGVAKCIVTYTSTSGSPHSITAAYSGDSNYNAAASNTVSEVVNKGTATDTITSSVNPTTVGTAVTYTATLSGPGVAPTGSVTFKDGSAAISSCGGSGVVALSSGVAKCIVSYTSTSGSPHSITAAYSGDSNYNSAASNTVSETVNKGTATDTITSSLNPTTVGTAVTYTATLTRPGIAPTGSVTFKDGSTAITSCGSSGVVTLSSGVAQCTLTYTSLSGSPHSITAAYSGDSNYSSASSNTVSETVNKGAATDTLTSSANPTSFGTAVTYTATLGGPGVAPTGSVTFKDGSSAITSCGSSGVVTVSSGVAKCIVSYTSTSGSPHSVSAPYSGDPNYNSASSNTVSEVVNKGTATDSLTSSVNPTTVGTAVTYTATLTGPGVAPTGTVTFKDGSTAITSCGSSGVVTLSSGVAKCIVTYTSTSSSPHSITAAYSGDPNYNSASSNTVSEVVNKGTATDIITSSLNATTVGTAVTYTATLTGPGVAPTGTVTFKDGSAAITSCGTSGVVALSSLGLAKCTVTYTSTSGSPHSVTAPYSGDPNYNAASSNTVSEVVNKATATDTLTSSVNPTSLGTAVTYTATLSGAGTAPTGTVTFKDGSAAITSCGSSGVVTLSSLGLAKCTVTYTSTSGSPHSVTAAYSGDSNYNAASSNTVSEVVNKTTATNTLASSVKPSMLGAAITYEVASGTYSLAGDNPKFTGSGNRAKGTNTCKGLA